MREASELPVHPITLRFYQDPRQLEKTYQRFAFKESLGHVRICHLMAIFFYAVYIFLDFYLAPENSSLFMTIRLGIVVPLFIVGIMLTYLPWYERICNLMLCFYILLTAAGFMSSRM